LRELEFATPALRDLEKIKAESEAAWGLVQRQRYMADLELRFGRLRERPEIGRPSKDRPNLRRLIVGRHAVFYEFDEARVRIIRVLHQRMDAPRHLGRTHQR
jgi:toxin ParE1/3/4